MSEELWRPLGVDSEDEIAAYDALHPDVPEWMASPLWAWIRSRLCRPSPTAGGYLWGLYDTALAMRMGQVLRIPMPQFTSQDSFSRWRAVEAKLRKHPHTLQIVDYILSAQHGIDAELNQILADSKSAWTIGERSGKTGLVRRVPLGVQLAADGVMANARMAGKRLAQGWEALYQLDPEPSAAYSLAIKAVEDAAIPVVSPTHAGATLGTVIRQMEDQKNWTLPMDREHSKAPTAEVVLGMMRLLWHGQHDRHGGQPSAPGNVSYEEANVAILMAVTLVGWFDAGLVARR